MDHIVIGYQQDFGLEYIDLTSGKIFKSASQSAQPKSIRSIDLMGADSAHDSSDGKWIASCIGNQICKVSEKEDPGKQFSVRRDKILTALSWSSDDKFIFWVEKAPTWRIPPRAHWRMNGTSLYTILRRARKVCLQRYVVDFPMGVCTGMS